VLLSAKSGWFAAAFTSGFTVSSALQVKVADSYCCKHESSAREIILKEDDPDALKTILDFGYTEEIGPSKDTSLQGTASNIHYLLKLYRTGDKYDFPEFQDRVVMCSKSSIYAWFNRSGTPLANDAGAHEELCGLIRDVYDLVGSEHQPSHPSVDMLLDFVDNAGPTNILHNTGGNQSLIVTASREIAEFGRDIFLQSMRMTGSSDADEKAKPLQLSCASESRLSVRHVATLE
jgi:hypothetical protein